MICKKCKSDNKEKTVHCTNCGYELNATLLGIKNLFLLLALIVIVLVCLGVFYFLLSENENVTGIKRVLVVENITASRRDMVSNFKEITITYNDGKVKKVQVYVPKENIAPILLSDIENAISISYGNTMIETMFWDKDSRIVFLKFPSDNKNESLNNAYKIGDWTAVEPFSLLSFDSPLLAKINSFKVVEKQGDLLLIEIDNLHTKSSSIIVQNNELVGWVFPTSQKNSAYLWLGEESAFPSDEPSIKPPICFLLFSDKATLSEKVNSLSNKLLRQYFVNLTQFIKKNDTKNIHYIDRESILIDTFCSRLSEIGAARDIADDISPEIVSAMKNKNILKSFAWANVSIYGYGRAIGLLNDVLGLNKKSGEFDAEIFSTISILYVNWIESLLSVGEDKNAMSVYNLAVKSLHKNQEITLLGAEIYLKFGDWEKAQSIIDAKKFDKQFLSTLERLKKIISDMKSSKNKIVIKFEANPTNSIFLDAMLNDRVGQKFIVDTGASIVSIPSETAKALNIKTSTSKEKTISTASGTFKTKELTLDSITINGRRVYDVQAVIIDLPDDKGIGLLGMSFLNRFHLELNNSSGELLLTPKEIN